MRKNNIIRSLLTISLCVLLAGCAKDNGRDDTGDINDELMLLAQIDGAAIDADVDQAVTKAPIHSWKNTATGFAYGTTADSYTDHWEAYIAAHGRVIFSPVRAYTPDGSDVHIKGYHPRGTLYEASPNRVYYTLTGQEDVMVSQNLYMGTLSNKNTDPVAMFAHKLSQFTFTIINDESSPYPPISYLNKVSITGTGSTASTALRSTCYINLQTSGLTFSGTTNSVFTAYDNPEGLKLAYGTKENLFQVMFEPNTKVKVIVEYTGLDGAKTTTEKTLGFTPAAGKAYEIKLRFTGSVVSFSQSMTNWVEGSSGISGSGSTSTNPIIVW